MKRLVAITGVCALLLCGQARADFITAISPGAGIPAAATLTASSFTPVGSAVLNNDFTGVGPANPNQVGLSFNVTQLFVPFTVNFTTASLDNPSPTAAEYFFTVNITNNLVGGNHPIGPIRIQAGAGSGLDTNGAGTNQKTPTPGNTAGAPNYQPAAHINSVLWFGGVNGGGGQIGPGQTATFTFSVDVLDSGNGAGGSSNFALTFTANPEPGTMAMAGLALGAGGFFVRRRRKGETKTEAVEA